MTLTKIYTEPAWIILVLIALLILAWHLPKWIANRRDSKLKQSKKVIYPAIYAVYCEARSDFRRKMITGTYIIGHNDMIEPPNWQEYAERLELLLMNKK